jgi:tRNA(His) guanylyltransferase
MNHDSLGNRMKIYEQVSDNYLTRRIPCVMRIDGKSFHVWTAGLSRPFDDNLRACMEYATYRLCKEIEGSRYAYTQSDEVSLLLVDYQTIATEPFFGYRIQKMTSVSASICTAAFATAAMHYLPEHLKKKGIPKFDARVFSLPKEEVSNYFLFRQQDCTRNSIQAVAQQNFSHRQLHKKSCDQIQDMLFKEKGINWNDLATRYKRGVSFYKIQKELQTDFSEKSPEACDLTFYRKKWIKDYEMPIITQDVNYVSKWVETEPDYTVKDVNNANLLSCVDIAL